MTTRTWILCSSASFALVALVAVAASGQAPAPKPPAAVIRFPSYLGEVRFEHKKHIDEFGLACTDCHHETNAGKLEFTHKDLIPTYRVDCQICHHEADVPMTPQSCSKCHPSTPTSNADETATSKVAMHKDCWKCHEIGQGPDASGKCPTCHKGPRKQW
jgi:hypothetical protein